MTDRSQELQDKQEAVVWAAKNWVDAHRFSEPDEDKSFGYQFRTAKASVELFEAVDRLWGK